MTTTHKGTRGVLVYGSHTGWTGRRPRAPWFDRFAFGFALGFGLGVLVVAAVVVLTATARAQEIDAAALAVAVQAVPDAVATETAPTPAARWRPTSRGGRDAVEALAAEHFPAELVGWAVRTARCETGGTFDLYARSAGFDRLWGVWYDFNGPWQVDAVTWGRRAAELFGGELADPWVGAAMAAWIRVNVGRSAWPHCG